MEDEWSGIMESPQCNRMLNTPLAGDGGGGCRNNGKQNSNFQTNLLLIQNSQKYEPILTTSQ